MRFCQIVQFRCVKWHIALPEWHPSHGKKYEFCAQSVSRPEVSAGMVVWSAAGWAACVTPEEWE